MFDELPREDNTVTVDAARPRLAVARFTAIRTMRSAASIASQDD